MDTEQTSSILGNIAEWLSTNPIFTILSFVAALFTIISAITIICKWVCKLLNRRAKQTPYTSELPHELQQQYLLGKIYIQPDITDTPPSVGNGTREPLHDFFLNKALIRNSAEPNTVYILFGDTGTGKTAALVHLYEEYNQRYAKTQPPFANIEFIPLRESESIDKIKQLPNPEETILLLDALDESPKVQDKTQRDLLIEELQPLLRTFARVVITCRPQLLEDSHAQVRLTHTGIRTATRFFEWTERYIAPFSNRQVQDYLDQVFTFRSENELRKRAEKIVSKHADIAIRPLILTFIRDIVESNRKTDTTLDIYDIIIEKTLERDIKILYPVPYPKPLPELKQRWWDICSEVAASMYQNNHHNSISDKELDAIPSVAAEPQLKQRILLTRAGDEDVYHFSHKSFYEYFMAYRFLLHPYKIKTVYNMDFALKLYDQLLQTRLNQETAHFPSLPSISTDTLANSLHNIGYALVDINHFSEAEPKYKETLKLFRELLQENPDAYLSDVAMTLNNLGALHNYSNQYDKAEKEYNEALKIRRQLAAQNPDAYLPDVAGTLNNLGALHNYSNQYDKAEEEYNEALKYYRQLAEQNPDAYLPDVAMTLNNLANNHSDTNQYDKAEVEFNETLKIRRQLAEKNPDAYLPDVATTLNNLGTLHNDTHQYDKAEEEYNEALQIRSQLAAQNPDAYLPNVAMTLNNLAILHSKTNQYDKAEVEYNDTLKIRRQLAEKNPDAYLCKIAGTLNNLAILHRKTNQYDKAEVENNEALKYYRQLAEQNPNAYLPDVAMTLYNMAHNYIAKGADYLPIAEQYAQESLEKYRIMAEKSHAAFDGDVKDAEKLLAEIQRLREQLKS